MKTAALWVCVDACDRLADGDEVVVVHEGLQEEVTLEQGETLPACLQFGICAIPADDNQKRPSDEGIVVEGLQFCRQGIRAIPAEFAVGQGQGLLRHHALIAPVTFEHIAIVEGRQEAMFNICVLGEIELATVACLSSDRVKARGAECHIQLAGNAKQAVADNL